MTVLGIRNNNPGNIRKNPANKWLGETQGVDPVFCVFDTMAHGIRALCEILINYQKLYNLRTIRDIISKWAPPTENDTHAYITNCADRTGFDPDAELDMTKEDDLSALAHAICDQECGEDAALILPAQLAAGVGDALQSKGYIKELPL